MRTRLLAAVVNGLAWPLVWVVARVDRADHRQAEKYADMGRRDGGEA